MFSGFFFLSVMDIVVTVLLNTHGALWENTEKCVRGRNKRRIQKKRQHV